MSVSLVRDLQCLAEVVISGAGPAGLLAARCILDRRPEANLEILEKRGTLTQQTGRVS